MSNRQSRAKARLKDGVISVRAILEHPMETGSRQDPVSGDLIPRNYIQQVVCEHNDKVVLTLDWGWGISKNPYLAFEIPDGRPGDIVRLSWVDNQHQSGSVEAQVG